MPREQNLKGMLRLLEAYFGIWDGNKQFQQQRSHLFMSGIHCQHGPINTKIVYYFQVLDSSIHQNSSPIHFMLQPITAGTRDAMVPL